MNFSQTSSSEDFEFTGSAREYFGIWIVNLALSIVTFGIYSAWAKVRTKKYFYQNTKVAGRGFDYHATGKQILIGRLIVAAGLVVFSILSAIPLVGILILLVLLFLLPVLIVRSLRFNAQMSSWSNVRFRFHGKAGRAFLSYMLYPFLTVFTLYLAWPFASRSVKNYVVNNHSLGDTAFSFESGIGAFYKAFLAAVGWVVLVTLVSSVIFGPPIVMIAQGFDNPESGAFALAIAGIYVFSFVTILPAISIYQAMIRNTTYNNTVLGGQHRFQSTVKPLKLLLIILTNTLATILSLGLLLPWAKVRYAKYMAANTTLIPGGSLDDFVGTIEKNAGAVGDAYSDIEGFDLGLPV
ncbi:YjgN family protein [Actibacterium lipolyticum]|uniref:Inner membrane protein YjgN n=1 Tax=Actibacterium lipolyticum TaxID=1524263 RepID=A0A238KWV0_9RHOB|nr:YjgN family protein [Actibacterium lipolyticum]SMX47051.1 Inner membrane protein YjgN [Actibacterium lipolyticum]